MIDQTQGAEVLAVFEELAASFSALDLPRFRRCYSLPCFMAVPDKPGVAVTSEAEFEAFFSPIITRLKAAGFARSVLGRTHVHFLAPGLALASMHWARCRADGSEIERFGATYTLTHTGGRWLIVTLAAHGEDGVLP
ncbi:MAG: DUF4440 domain-containing protein [Gammaproteobacteria bacterium]|nr:DUF4440 domain-containing protein [Gammaproteobacteria bacterium]MBI5615558.1 DUF4440 domain-containing protein [Gammaproteobacteria bacterium]